MQVLKEEVKNAIIETARDEFVQHGFEKASIRKIAKAAGTTIGNFYNYFTSKEELFYEITTPVFLDVVSFIKNHNQMIVSYEDFDSKYMDISMMKSIMDKALENIPDHYVKSLIILIDGSKGTRYEHAKEEIISFLNEHFEEHVGTRPEAVRVKFHHGIMKVVASSFLEGIMVILRSDCEYREKTKLISDFVLFYCMSLIKFSEDQ